MKNVFEVLRGKEQDILRIRKEIDALRTAARLLDDSPQAHQKPDGNLLEMRDSANVLLTELDAEQPTA